MVKCFRLVHVALSSHRELIYEYDSYLVSSSTDLACRPRHRNFHGLPLQGRELTDKHVLVEGIMNKVGFEPDRLKKHEEEIFALLKELPPEFLRSGSGGWTFLNACNDKHGHQWTGFHRTMEQLFLLGIGLKKVTLLFPREAWGMLPGGMPYYTVEDVEETSALATEVETV